MMRWPMTLGCGTGRALSVLALSTLCACSRPPGRWSETEWWPTYAALPQVELDAVGAGALDETTRPFPALRSISVSPGGRIVVAQQEIPAIWVYDGRGRSLGKAGRSEIMDLRGPGRTRVWATRAGWLPGDRLWVAERGGSIAVFNADLDFADVWDVPGDGDPLAVLPRRGGLVALVLSRDGASSTLRRVSRNGGAERIATIAAGDTLAACADGDCFVTIEARPGGAGYDVVRHSTGGANDPVRFTLPAAPDAAREGEGGGPLPRPVSDVLADDAGRVWLGLTADGSDRVYWMVLNASGVPIGRFELPAGDRGILVSDDVLWVRRDADGVTWLHRYAIRWP